MTNAGEDNVPDTIDELLGRQKARKVKGLGSSEEELLALSQQYRDEDLQRLARAKEEGRTEIISIEFPKPDVEAIRKWIQHTGEYESVEDFVRKGVWEDLENLPWEDLNR